MGYQALKEAARWARENTVIPSSLQERKITIRGELNERLTKLYATKAQLQRQLKMAQREIDEIEELLHPHEEKKHLCDPRDLRQGSCPVCVRTEMEGKNG